MHRDKVEEGTGGWGGAGWWKGTNLQQTCDLDLRERGLKSTFKLSTNKMNPLCIQNPVEF